MIINIIGIVSWIVKIYDIVILLVYGTRSLILDCLVLNFIIIFWSFWIIDRRFIYRLIKLLILLFFTIFLQLVHFFAKLTLNIYLGDYAFMCKWTQKWFISTIIFFENFQVRDSPDGLLRCVFLSRFTSYMHTYRSLVIHIGGW